MPGLISAIDTYYSFVTQQLVKLNAQITVNGQPQDLSLGGVTDAHDWPQTQVTEGTVYLINLNRQAMGGTISQRQYCYYLQWAWIVIGQDIPGTAIAANRGDRYRTNAQIEEFLRQANYPGFTQKTGVACDSQGNLTFTPSHSTLPLSGYEPLTWSELTFKSHEDEASGLIYGVATVELYAYSDVSALVA